MIRPLGSPLDRAAPKPTRGLKMLLSQRAVMKGRTRLSPEGRWALEWESFKQHVAYPSLWDWTSGGNLRNTLNCSMCLAPGDLWRYTEPDKDGKWWALSGLDLHHVKERSIRPDLRFALSNIVPLCRVCHS